MTDMNGTDNTKRLRSGAVPGRAQLGARAAAQPAQPAQPGRRAAGFTLMETMLVVGITAVLLGLVFVGVIQLWKSLQQTELDATAKEVYAAAQNHLSLAESQGLLEAGSGVSLGTRESLDASADQDDVYFFVYSPAVSADSANSPDNKASVLNLMLPFGSIDETVRVGGSYVIRYQPSTGTVIDVFYAKDVDFSETVVSGLDVQSLVAAYAGDDNREARQDYRNTGRVIGYYGAENEGDTALKLKAPTLQVVNGDTLQVKVTNPNNSGHEYEVKLVVESESKTAYAAAMWFDETEAKVSGNTYTFTLDDVTRAEGRFYYVAEHRDADHKKANASAFVPGENLRIYAWVAAKDVASVVAKSATATTNSLFADARNAHKASEGATLSPAEALATGGATALGTAAAAAASDEPQGRTVEIVTFRHLANLSSLVSHFNYQAVRDAEGRVTGLNPVANEYGFVTAVQKTDMNWNDFMGDEHAAVSMWRDGAVASKQGTFLPVEPSYVLAFDGGGYSIENIAVDVEGSAGVFAALAMSGSAASNLTLVDSAITSSAGPAGALAGEVGAGVEVSNVLARDGLSDYSASAQITGATAAGGLVGLLNGGTVKESAAAVYVSATGGSGAAGGLVGTAQNGATIRDSYSGGHTSAGAYLATTSGAARLNVTGANAGGLVGSLASSSAVNCYSTCSASGSATSGGFAGATSVGSIGNCYSTGLVTGGTAGAFAGSVSGTTLSGDWYFGFVNQNAGAVGNATVGGVSAFDDSVDLYNTFATGSAAGTANSNAIPYDEVLARNYNGKYPFRTVANLGGANTEMLTITHVGDWPSPEALAKNYQ